MGLALITGGCNAFGLMAAEILGDQYDVVVTTRDAAKASDFSDKHGIEARSLDLGDFQEMESFVESAGGPIDVLVNAAVAREPVKPNDLYDWEDWDRELRINIGATYKMSVEVAKSMRARGFGRIVNVGSVYGAVAVQHDIYPEGMAPTHIVYSVSKAGVAHLTRELASMWAPFGITVNCLSFGGLAANQPEAFVERYNQKVPMGRMGRYPELAPALRMLTARDNSYMTGQEVMVDGGLTVW